MRPPATTCQLIIFMLRLTSIGGESSSPSFPLPPDFNVEEKAEATAGALHPRNSHPQPRFCSEILCSPRETNWGNWLDYFSTCPKKSFVVGMQLKTDPFHGNHNTGGKADNTGLNGIKFLCGKLRGPGSTGDGKTSQMILRNITNQVQKWGKWGQVMTCKKGQVVIGFQLRVRKALPNGKGYGFKMDDVATCNMRLFCSDGQILEGDGRNEWGDWTKKMICPKGHAICSLKTQVEADQYIFDDTALNNVDTGCCPFQGSKEGNDHPTSVHNPQSFHLHLNSNSSHFQHETASSVDESLLGGGSKHDKNLKEAYNYLIWLKSNVFNFLHL